MKLDLNKPVQYRNGAAATIIATNVVADLPIPDLEGIRKDRTVVSHSPKYGYRWHHADGTRGLFSTGGAFDLVNVPEETFGFANVYGVKNNRLLLSEVFDDRAGAEAQHRRDMSTRTGVLKLTYVSGVIRSTAFVAD